MRCTTLALWVCFCLPSRGPLHGQTLPNPVVPDGLGLNIHRTDLGPAELNMLSATGARWVRMDLTWAATKHQKGKYDFSAYDRLVTSPSPYRPALARSARRRIRAGRVRQ